MKANVLMNCIPTAAIRTVRVAAGIGRCSASAAMLLNPENVVAFNRWALETAEALPHSRERAFLVAGAGT